MEESSESQDLPPGGRLLDPPEEEDEEREGFSFFCIYSTVPYNESTATVDVVKEKKHQPFRD